MLVLRSFFTASLFGIVVRDSFLLPSSFYIPTTNRIGDNMRGVLILRYIILLFYRIFISDLPLYKKIEHYHSKSLVEFEIRQTTNYLIQSSFSK